jgi:hypothetical protein
MSGDAERDRRHVVAMSNANGLVATVVTYNIDPANADKLRDAIREHLVPAARKMEGYRGFLALDLGEGKRLGCVVFDSVEHGRAAQAIITAAAKEGGVYALMTEPQKGMFGNAIVADGIFQ